MKTNIDVTLNVLHKGQTLSLGQSDAFAKWLKGLRDRDGRLRILKRLRRLGDGQFGDVKAVGEGVHE